MDGEVTAHWKEVGQWWNGEGGVEVVRTIGQDGVPRDRELPLPPLAVGHAVKAMEENHTEDLDLRIRKQRDIKVAKACGSLVSYPAVSARGAPPIAYVPLHVRSGYAFGRSTMLAEEIPALAAMLGLPAVAISDPFSLAGAVEFARAAQRHHIHSLIGATFELESGGEIGLIAKSKLGYRSLSELITECHLGEPRGYPLARWHRLERYSRDLLCLTGGDRGPLDRLLARHDFDGARNLIQRLIDLYGRENVVVEIDRAALPWQIRVSRLALELAEAMGVIAVASGEVTHAVREHFPAQDILVCVETLCGVEEVIGRKPLRHPDQPSVVDVPRRALNAERYLRSAAEMAVIYGDRPDLLENTRRVFDRCDPDVLPGRTHLPQLYPDEGHVLREITIAGAHVRHGQISRKLQARLDHELRGIAQGGFARHFLVAWDFCRWSESQGILFSGRGSVVDSAVAYCLGFSRIDAFAHKLHFERFLPGDGSKRPDIDIDFEAARRDEVREYMTRKYGEDRVATVAAFGAYCTRGIVREVGKAMGLSPEITGFLSKRLHGGVRADQLEDALDKRPELKGSKIPRERYRWVFHLAERLMDVPRNVRAHSSGVVISADPLAWTVPVIWGAGPREDEADGHLRLIQWDKRSAKHYFDKFDILCLRGQDVLSGTERFVRSRQPDFRVNQVRLDDEDTYRTMRAGELIGIPQSASPAMRQAHIRLQTRDLNDASLVQAGIRPGVGGAVKINELIARRRGKPYELLHPEMEHILGHTYGLIVFQEQVDLLLSTFAGYTPGEAEEIREAIHKRRRESFVTTLREEIVDRIRKRGYGEQVAHEVYDLVAGFQGYGFAQGHALAFAEISIRSIYCQQNFPAPYFAALLNAQPAGYYGPCTIANEARARGVGVLRPDVNRSDYDFTVEPEFAERLMVPDAAIRVGLRQVGGISRETAERIVDERKLSPFHTIFDLALRVRPARDELEKLVLCGALDGLHPNRRALLWAVAPAIRHAAAFMTSGDHPTLPLDVPEPAMDELVPDFSLMDRRVRERIVLGMDVEAHLMAFERPRVIAKGGMTTQEAIRLKGGTRGFAVGNPIRLRFPPTQSGRRVLFFDLEDETGLLNVTCFDETYQRDGHAIITHPYVTVVGEAQDRDGHIAFLAHRVFPFRAQVEETVAEPRDLPITVADFLMR